MSIRSAFSILVFLVITGLLTAVAHDASQLGTISTKTKLNSSPAAAVPGCSAEWHRVKSPSPAHQEFDANQLSGVYALSSTDVWAVGWSLSYKDPHYRTLAEHWDGAQWKVVATPNSSQSNNYLTAVSAVGPNDVWAVGQQDDGVGDSWTLVEHWDGKVWTIDKSASKRGSLGGVVALSSTHVSATGFGIEEWDGVSWALQRIGAANYLKDISGKTGDLWAAGYRTVQPFGPVLAMTYHWDGAAWTRHHAFSPLQTSTDDENVLNGIASAPGDDHPWSVGEYGNSDSGPRFHTLIERWNGAKWIRVPAPNPGGSQLDNFLTHITALSSTNAWAVGYISDSASNTQTIIEQWDGKSWTVAPSPKQGVLLSITGDRAKGNLWAVGSVYATNYQSTMIVEACGR